MCTRLFPYVRPFDELPTCQGCTPPPLAFSPEGSSSAPETPLRYKTADDEWMDGIIMLLDQKQKTSLAYVDISGWVFSSSTKCQKGKEKVMMMMIDDDDGHR